MRIMLTSLIAALLANWPGISVAAELPPSPVCWPIHFAGVTLAVNTEDQVSRLLGQGAVRNNGGDISRYYVDPAQRGTLHLEFSDSQVEIMTLEEGVSQDLKAAELVRAASKWFDPYERFGNWGGLQLGSSKQDVVKNLGPPKAGRDSNAWEYQSKCACELPEYFTLYFKSGHIFKIVFSAPSG